MTDLIESLKKYTSIYGPPGLEDEVKEAIISDLEDFVDEITIDKLGNLIVLQKGSEYPDGPKIMLDAHMDEISLVIKHIDSDGMIWVAKHGGMMENLLPGHHVMILARTGKIPGVVGVKSGHLSTPEERKIVPTISNIWVDIGCNTQEEVEETGVRIGDFITYEKKFKTLGKYICSTTLDDRIGVLVLIETLKKLRKSDRSISVYGVFSVQEEVGCRGTQIAAHRINPDIAIIVDTGFGADPATTMKETRVKIGEGPLIRTWNNSIQCLENL